MRSIGDRRDHGGARSLATRARHDPEDTPWMSEIQALLDTLTGLPRTRPAGPAEAEELLARLRSAAARWADVLYEAHEGVRQQLPPRAEASLTLAFRRAEESYVELEIALKDCTEHRDPAI